MYAGRQHNFSQWIDDPYLAGKHRRKREIKNKMARRSRQKNRRK